MDIKLPFAFNANPRIFMRRAGYAEIHDFHTKKFSYVKRLSVDHYPRFHVYVNEKEGQQYINLHLDQKKASYQGSSAHNAEYDGELVEREGARLLGLINNQMHNQDQSAERESPTEEKRGLFGRLFKH